MSHTFVPPKPTKSKRLPSPLKTAADQPCHSRPLSGGPTGFPVAKSSRRTSVTGGPYALTPSRVTISSGSPEEATRTRRR